MKLESTPGVLGNRNGGKMLQNICPCGKLFHSHLELSSNSGTSHPNIVQIWGTASSNGIHAMLFNDDLITLQEVLDRHRGSPVLTVYIYAICEAFNYLYSAFQQAFYYCISTQNLAQYQHFNLSSPTTVNRAVFHCSSDRLGNPDEIAFLPSTEAPSLGKCWTYKRGTGEVMPDNWTRYFSMAQPSKPYFSPSAHYGQFRGLWYRFRSRFPIILEEMNFVLGISGPTGDPPMGFLFLCPTELFRIGPSSFRWSACPAYWSLDPASVDHLSHDEATRLGFPPFVLTTRADGWYWDTSVYEGLRQFHQAKGFDPYSQDVTRHLDLPLYQVSCQVEAPFTYVNTEEYESEYPRTSACEASAKSIEEEMVSEEMFAPSRSLNFLMTIQLG
ncbi:hypothetical protein C8R45DRAFT_940592 [Mycena sanguinolenta]|nr:hypothetical protein C8R45DRAFT_940592 [Mycena sanguinolenta]